MSPSLPKVIFIDAFGTLFGVKGSVGEIYSGLARTAQVNTDPQAVNRAFFQSFAASERLAFRSEEHTSELQSLTNLVCRLLLEKKKKQTTKKKNSKQKQLIHSMRTLMFDIC